MLYVSSHGFHKLKRFLETSSQLFGSLCNLFRFFFFFNKGESIVCVLKQIIASYIDSTAYLKNLTF